MPLSGSLVTVAQWRGKLAHLIPRGCQGAARRAAQIKRRL